MHRSTLVHATFLTLSLMGQGAIAQPASGVATSPASPSQQAAAAASPQQTGLDQEVTRLKTLVAELQRQIDRQQGAQLNLARRMMPAVNGLRPVHKFVEWQVEQERYFGPGPVAPRVIVARRCRGATGHANRWPWIIIDVTSFHKLIRSSLVAVLGRRRIKTAVASRRCIHAWPIRHAVAPFFHNTLAPRHTQPTLSLLLRTAECSGERAFAGGLRRRRRGSAWSRCRLRRPLR